MLLLNMDGRVQCLQRMTLLSLKRKIILLKTTKIPDSFLLKYRSHPVAPVNVNSLTGAG